MPEGDSVLQLSNRLQFMEGRRVTSSSLRVPRYATVRFDGLVCEEVWPYGKHLFMDFGGELILHTHLKMEGTWAIHYAGDRWRKPGHSARVVLQMENAPRDIELVGHWLGHVGVFPTREFEQRMAHLGPDILAPEWEEGGFEEAVRRIAEWAAAKGYTDRIEALGFIDGGVSLDWLGQAGCRVVNLLAKGSLKHCREQLRRTPQEHLCDIRATIGGAVARGMKVNVYLEDWSNGMQDSPGYVYTILDGLADAPVQRFMCPDTLGILDPYATERFCRDMVTRYPQLRFDFHAHNDYDLAVANTAAAVKAGFHGVHVTINGLGERAGNAPLSSTVAVLHDRLHCLTGIDETKINHVSRMVETYTGIRLSLIHI